ncbi:hypothetical protein GGS21DRAFT_132196 [Xylaria nigripes]|nr:hypothetical protein GGS21DRAFT_132196 [Xylaria nigripes]
MHTEQLLPTSLRLHASSLSSTLNVHTIIPTYLLTYLVYGLSTYLISHCNPYRPLFLPRLPIASFPSPTLSPTTPSPIPFTFTFIITITILITLKSSPKKLPKRQHRYHYLKSWSSRSSTCRTLLSLASRPCSHP